MDGADADDEQCQLYLAPIVCSQRVGRRTATIARIDHEKKATPKAPPLFAATAQFLTPLSSTIRCFFFVSFT